MSAASIGALPAPVIEPGFFTAKPCASPWSSARSSRSSPGTVGVFTVIRGQSFAGEALGDSTRPAAPAAFLVGVGPLWGFLAVERRRRRGDGADRHPAPARTRPRDRNRAGRRPRPGRAAAVPDTTFHSTTGADRHDPVWVGVRRRQLDDPAGRAARLRRARDRGDALPAAAAQLAQRRDGCRPRAFTCACSAPPTCSRWRSRWRWRRSRSARSSRRRCSSGRLRSRCA